MRILIFSYQINPRPNPLVVSLSNHLLELALCPVPKPDFCVSFDRLRMSGEVEGLLHHGNSQRPYLGLLCSLAR